MTQRTCSLDGCDKPHRALGRCEAHYQRHMKLNRVRGCKLPACDKPLDSRGFCASHARQLRQGQELRPLRVWGIKTCSMQGCDEPHQGLGLCNKHHLRLRNHGDPNHVRVAPRRYALNESFFDEITTEVQAYWLGFITADGGISQTDKTNTLRVGLQLRDEGHLLRMNADLGSDRPFLYPARQHPAVVASFDSYRLIGALGRLGVGPHKSRVVKPWPGPDDLMGHYWRGVFDGDGSIVYSPSNRDWILSLAGNRFVVGAFADWARERSGSRAKLRHHRGATWMWAAGGSSGPQSLAVALYRDASVSLSRKQETADRLMAIKFPGRGGRR
jgi:hypothetical protein